MFVSSIKHLKTGRRKASTVMCYFRTRHSSRTTINL